MWFIAQDDAKVDFAIYSCDTYKDMGTYNFYGCHEDVCHIIYFPASGKDYEVPRFRRTITTSEGSIVYFNEYCGNGNRTLRIWRLVKYTEIGPKAWQLFWEVKLVSLTKLGISYFSVVMHPLNCEIIYLWSRNKKGMLLFNLRTKVFSLHKETDDARKCMDGCILSFNSCREYMENVSNYFLPSFQGGSNHLLASQFVLPRWLHYLPRPKPS
ncbi:PREDICTED: putative F-box protein At3g23950 [Camelina sativa]|uniref:F-box protein At3g23950 n=1 Tax=Camelina sativa TaxID=90675 RepID=A0ABM0T7K7_CAMSA|nr:PREDICTED: putative F-box protein At3g23950 [Camelina sativa]